MSRVTFAARGGADLNVEREAVDRLAASFRGELVDRDHAGYPAARAIWNGMIQTRPALVARCRGVSDVAAAVTFARDHGILIAVRSGGHNVAGGASCEGGIVIDLSLMRGVRVDPQARTVRVEGGALLGDLDAATQLFGLAVPAGVVSTTGVAGLTLGGGTGWQMRNRGLSIDNLISADVVTSSGELITASATQNEDLFWGLRGGGGSFGVVTSLEFRAYPVGPMVTLGDPHYPLEMGETVARAFRDFMAQAPESVGGALSFWTIPPHPAFPAEFHGRRTVQPFLVCTDDLERGQQLIEPMRKIAEPMFDLSGPIPWTVLQSLFDPFFPTATYQYYWKSLYLASVGDDVIDQVVSIARSVPSDKTQMIFQPLGGAVARVGAQETAFGPRDMPYLLSFDSTWDNPADTQLNVDWTRRAWADMQRFSTGGLYLNFAGLAEEDELVESAVGSDNYRRLVALKDRYDPENLFRTRLTVPPSAAARSVGADSLP